MCTVQRATSACSTVPARSSKSLPHSHSLSQLARGVGIAAVGRATTLFANASTGGALLSGALAGVSNQYLGYTATLVISGGITLLAALLFAFARTEHAGHSSSRRLTG